MKTMKKISYLLVVMLTLFLLSACVLEETPEEPTPTEVDPVAIFTSAAMTVEADLTQTALSFSPTSPPASATATLIPATATLVDLSASPAPSLPAVEVAFTLPAGAPTLGVGTPSPAPSATQVVLNATQSGPICDEMTYGSPLDITYEDGSTVYAGENFEKIWRVYNTGICTWDDGYRLIPIGVESSNPADLNPLDSPNPAWEIKDAYHAVAPGGVVDIGVDLSAPLTAGEYATHYILQNDKGFNFGGVLSVRVVVKNK